MSKFRSFLYKAARTQGDLEAAASGNPKRINRRIKNRIVGRALSPVWRRLWK